MNYNVIKIAQYVIGLMISCTSTALIFMGLAQAGLPLS